MFVGSKPKIKQNKRKATINKGTIKEKNQKADTGSEEVWSSSQREEES